MYLRELINNFSIEGFQNFISDKNSSFVEEIEEYSFYEDNNFTEIKSIGKLEDNFFTLKVFYIKVETELNNRSSNKLQYDLGKKILKNHNIDAGIFIFYSELTKNFRFSFIYINYLGIKREFSYYKRYTFFVSPNLTNRTFIEQISKCDFSSIDKIKEAFSVEKLSDDFFEKYKQHFNKFNEFTYNNFRNLMPFLSYKEEEREKAIRDFNKKLLGRIVFIYFLQKKGWIGVPIENANWTGGSTNFLFDNFKRYENNKKNFYIEFLEPLFYETLNKKRDNDIFYLTNTKIPFLNGGLFEPEETEKLGILFYPNELFKDLFEYFNQYNFTIVEDSLEDQEVAIDPEMLGHIFENLLEDNKDKGAYYTPKEIVKFMCQEALINYLDINLNNNSVIIPKELISNFIKYRLRNDEKGIIKKNAKKIEELLDNIKILDPAIGSGAFPMGILHEIFNAKLNLDWTLDKAETKRKIIENSIYGVDIEKGAVDIARLRFWLSLVVDEDIPSPLPNLDYKIMVGNSLTGVNFDNQNMFDANFLNEIQELRHRFYNQQDIEQKRLLKEEIENRINELSQALNINLQQGFNFKIEFSEVFDSKGGFDIVIGNPPYGAKIENKNEDFFMRNYKMRTSETAILFIEKGFYLLNALGIQSYIIPKSYIFSSKYKQARDFTKEKLLLISDCSEAFKKVRLEQCIFLLSKVKSQTYYYSFKYLENKKFKLVDKIDKKFIDIFDFILNNITNKEINLGLKINKIGLFLGDICTNKRGDNIQSYISKSGNLKVIGGKEIDRYFIKKQKGFISSNILKNDKSIIKEESILVQNIVAHIKKPYEHIKIIACIPNSNYKEYVITDTINQITINNKNFSKEFIWSILNSKLINWYVYLFIFGKAIRTMHLDNTVTDIIPIPKITLENQKIYIELFNKIIEKKKNNINTEDLEKEIDKLVYQLYDLTNEEISIIENIS